MSTSAVSGTSLAGRGSASSPCARSATALIPPWLYRSRLLHLGHDLRGRPRRLHNVYLAHTSSLHVLSPCCLSPYCVLTNRFHCSHHRAVVFNLSNSDKRRPLPDTGKPIARWGRKAA